MVSESTPRKRCGERAVTLPDPQAGGVVGAAAMITFGVAALVRRRLAVADLLAVMAGLRSRLNGVCVKYLTARCCLSLQTKSGY